MNYPMISLLVPAYNEEKSIERILIHLVTELCYPDFEVIVGVEESSDATLEIVERLSKKYLKIRYFYNEKRLGLIKNMNKLISFSKGEIIVKTDADRMFANPKTCLFNLARHYMDSRIGGIYFGGERDFNGGIFAFTEPEYRELIEREWKENFIVRGERFVAVIVTGFWRTLFPVTNEIDLPVNANSFRRNAVIELDGEMIHDDVEIVYSVLEKGYWIDFADDVIHMSLGERPTTTKALFKQKVKSHIGWSKAGKKYELNFRKFYFRLFIHLIKNIKKASLMDLIAFMYWLFIYFTAFLTAIPKRKLSPLKTWSKDS